VTTIDRPATATPVAGIDLEDPLGVAERLRDEFRVGAPSATGSVRSRMSSARRSARRDCSGSWFRVSTAALAGRSGS
jgi:hypothetical protein